MRSRAASARRIRSTARSRSSIGGPFVARLGERNAGMSASSSPRVRRICATRLGIPSSASPPDAPTDLGMIQRRCGTRLMTIKYPAWVCALALVAVACAPQATAPPLSPTTAPTPTASPTPGLRVAISATIATERRWYTVPDGLDRLLVKVTATFDADPTAGAPFLTIAGGPELPLAHL